MKKCMYCDKKLSRTTKGNRCKECYIKNILIPLNKKRIGYNVTENTKEKIRVKQLGELGHNWKGDSVGNGQLHTWVKLHLPKTELCQKCNKVPPYDLANKGIYNRELKNWEWLCRRCHITGDGRLKHLH